jgi:hypothetical protein
LSIVIRKGRHLLIRTLVGVLALCDRSPSIAQGNIGWSPERPIALEDLRGTAPQLADSSTQYCHCDVHLDAAYQMNAAQFGLTKNFNPYVSTYFTSGNSWISPGEGTGRFVQLCQLQFDMTEWHARMLRARLSQAKRFGNPDFLKADHDSVSAQLNARMAQLNSEYSVATTADQQQAVIDRWKIIVSEGLAAYPDNCKTCTPPKRKKKG